MSRSSIVDHNLNWAEEREDCGDRGDVNALSVSLSTCDLHCSTATAGGRGGREVRGEGGGGGGEGEGEGEGRVGEEKEKGKRRDKEEGEEGKQY